MIRAATKPSTATIPAVSYIRMSSDKQEDSPEQQRDEVRALAAREGFTLIREYRDLGISGSESTKREDFRRLIRDAQERKDFQVIVCRDQDRFSRFDALEANHYWFLLRQAGVRIVTARQGELNFDELAGWLMASVVQHGKAQYLRDVSANVVGARLRNAQQGKWTHNRAPYGYVRTKEGLLVLADEERVNAVRWIFQTYVDRDISLYDIAEKLNRDGIPSPSGKRWQIATIQTILRREAYMGQTEQFKFRKGKFFTVSERRVTPVTPDVARVAPKTERFIVQCPQIIDQSLWKRAKAKAVSRRKATHPRAKTDRALLAGLIVCGHCGEPMYGTTERRKGRSYRVFVCSSYNSGGTHRCHHNVLHEAPVLDYVLAQIHDRLLAPENFQRLKGELRRQASKREGSGDANATKRLKARLAKADAEIRQAVKELRRTPDDLYPLAVEELRTLRASRDQLASELDAQEARDRGRTGDVASDVAKALGAIETLRERVTDADPTIAREAINRVCARIDVWFDHTKFKKMTRSRFKKGLVTFRPVADSVALGGRS